MRGSSLMAVLVASGCQCLIPVDEVRGRRDAGPDAPDAGLLQGCQVAEDCAGAPQVVGACAALGGPPDAGYACLGGRCIAQCGLDLGLTCALQPGVECLRCPPTASCIPPDCGGGFAFTFTVTEVRCVGAPSLAVGDQVREAPDGGCGVPFFLSTDGGETVLGTLRLQDGRMLTFDAPLLGGSCFAVELPTGAPRLILECPRCQVALGP